MLEDMLRTWVLDFGGLCHVHVIEFAYNNSYQASIKISPFEALYMHRYWTPLSCDDIGERALLGPDMVVYAAEKVKEIRERLRVAQYWQRNWADNYQRSLKFEVGDLVFLTISPTRGKLSPRFIRPFGILERVSIVAYLQALPPTLEGVHDVFYISQLRRYVADPSHGLDHSEFEVRLSLT